ncbi:MAG: hypothetical protein HOK60_01775 [Planctomycetes bacterium]|nr:hypothetical protein [Planctomycetota bacterium]MBT7104807.1 hypothetical protein [Planctomycetota bacterium]MBT7639136.1 hypothetical protein [Planctomycetota bacterium]
MVNQDENQGANDSNGIGSPFDLGSFWQGLGPGGRLGLGFVLLFVFAFFFNSQEKNEWVDIPAGDSTQNYQIKETLQSRNIDFRFAEDGGLQVQKSDFDQVERELSGTAEKEGSSEPFAGSLFESSHQSQQRWEKSEVEKLEQDLARYEGVDSVSVTSSKSTGRSVLASSIHVNSVSVQAELDKEFWSDGLSQQMARTIASHVSGVYGVSLDKIIMTDTTGLSYDLSSTAVPSGDIVQKKHDVEVYVTRYLSNFFSPEMFRVLVDVSLFEPQQQSHPRDKATSLVPGLHDLQKQVASYAPISFQFAESVVSRATSQQIPDRTEVDPQLAEIHQVAVTVVLDRNEAINRIVAGAPIDYSTGTGGVIPADPSAALALREDTATIVAGIKSHLKVRLGGGAAVVAKVVHSSFGGVLVANNATTGVVGPYVTAMTDYPNALLWMVLIGIVSVYWVIRYGPVESSMTPAIVGFGEARFSTPKVRETVNSIFEECENSFTEKAIQEISNLGFESSVEIIRFVSSDAGLSVPGRHILALLVLEQSSFRSQIFKTLNPEELTTLSAMIREVREIDQESIIDALAALELFQNSTVAPVNGQLLEGFVGEIPTQVDVEKSVIDDIRSSDEKLANMIESHRHDLNSREVQSS